MKNIDTRLLSELPVIIDGAGNYKTRDGRTVTIHDVDGKGTFAARGSVWRYANKMGLNPKFNIWHVSGRLYVLHTSNLDIVEKIA